MRVQRSRESLSLSRVDLASRAGEARSEVVVRNQLQRAHVQNESFIIRDQIALERRKQSIGKAAKSARVRQWKILAGERKEVETEKLFLDRAHETAESCSKLQRDLEGMDRQLAAA